VSTWLARHAEVFQGDPVMPLGLFSAWSRGSTTTAGRAGLPRGIGCSPIQRVVRLVLHNSSCSSDCPRREKWRAEKEEYIGFWSLFVILSYALM